MRGREGERERGRERERERNALFAGHILKDNMEATGGEIALHGRLSQALNS